MDELLYFVWRLDAYYLYELVDDEFKKLGRSKSPLELEDKFNVHTKLKQK